MESKASRPECVGVALPWLQHLFGSHGMTIAFDADFQDSPPRSQSRLPLVIAAVAITAMAAIGARATIVRFAPRTAALFETLGLPVNLKGLAIERVNAKVLADGERRILVVEGDLVNSGDRAEVARPLAVSVRDADGQQLYTWTTRAPQQEVGVNDRAAFVARLASPPVDAASVVVEFDREGAEPSQQAKGAAKKGVARPLFQGSSTESQYK